ncbi:MAG: DnaJ domain-containing protein [Patescibacteria group bacterium]
MSDKQTAEEAKRVEKNRKEAQKRHAREDAHRIDAYAVLGVPQTATKDKIKAVYRALSRKLHPDHGGNEEKFKEVNNAWSILGDQDSRDAYDQARADYLKNKIIEKEKKDKKDAAIAAAAARKKKKLEDDEDAARIENAAWDAQKAWAAQAAKDAADAQAKAQARAKAVAASHAATQATSTPTPTPTPTRPPRPRPTYTPPKPTPTPTPTPTSFQPLSWPPRRVRNKSRKPWFEKGWVAFIAFASIVVIIILAFGKHAESEKAKMYPLKVCMVSIIPNSTRVDKNGICIYRFNPFYDLDYYTLEKAIYLRDINLYDTKNQGNCVVQKNRTVRFRVPKSYPQQETFGDVCKYTVDD